MVPYFYHFKCSLYTINKLCPGRNIVFSTILPRKEWHYSINHKAIKDIPKRLNRDIISYLLQHNGCYIKYDDLDDCHDVVYAHDGVHLSF
jgi:hypothetical protein